MSCLKSASHASVQLSMQYNAGEKQEACLLMHMWELGGKLKLTLTITTYFCGVASKQLRGSFLVSFE